MLCYYQIEHKELYNIYFFPEPYEKFQRISIFKNPDKPQKLQLKLTTFLSNVYFNYNYDESLWLSIT
jgi:hypothetical protein